MARDRRFVDVFDFKSSLTSPRRERRRVGRYTHPKRILAIYHDAIPQSDRSVCRRKCANRLAETKQGAGPRAHLRSPPHSSRTSSNYCDISICYMGRGRPDWPLCQPVRRPEILPLAIREMLESSRADGGSEIVESRVPPYANSGYRGVYALFIGVDRGRLDFESLVMNAPTRAATSSGFSSSAKWPASIR